MASLHEHAVEVAATDRAQLLAVAGIVWLWFAAHERDKVLTLKLPLIGTVKTIRVRDLRFLFVAFFGSGPI